MYDASKISGDDMLLTGPAYPLCEVEGPGPSGGVLPRKPTPDTAFRVKACPMDGSFYVYPCCKLQHARVVAGLSPDSVAQVLGVCRATVWRYLSGKSKLPPVGLRDARLSLGAPAGARMGNLPD